MNALRSLGRRSTQLNEKTHGDPKKIIADNHNTKREIKECAIKLNRCINAATNEMVLEWPEKQRWVKSEIPTCDQAEQINERPMEKTNATCDASTQTTTQEETEEVVIMCTGVTTIEQWSNIE